MASRSTIAGVALDGDGDKNTEYLEKSRGNGNWLPSWALCNALARMQQSRVTEDSTLKGETPTLTAARVLREASRKNCKDVVIHIVHDIFPLLEKEEQARHTLDIDTTVYTWRDKACDALKDQLELAHANDLKNPRKYTIGVDVRDENGDSALHHAVAAGAAIATQTLLELGADVNARSGNGCTPAHLCFDSFACFDLLLEHGAAVNMLDDKGWTPLMHASQRGNENAIAMLIVAKADLDVVSPEGDTAISIARRWRQDAVVPLLAEPNDFDIFTKAWSCTKAVQLMDAIENDDVETVERIVQAQPRLSEDWRSSLGRSALTTAVQVNSKKVIAALLENGFDPNHVEDSLDACTTHKSSQGMTPFHVAALVGDQDVARMLLEHGGDYNLKDQDGWTPVHIACFRKSSEKHREFATVILEYDMEKNK